MVVMARSSTPLETDELISWSPSCSKMGFEENLFYSLGIENFEKILHFSFIHLLWALRPLKRFKIPPQSKFSIPFTGLSLILMRSFINPISYNKRGEAPAARLFFARSKNSSQRFARFDGSNEVEEGSY